MILKCPECGLQISDKAATCPHCGYPLKEDAPKKRKYTKRRKRLPNGFGQISKIKYGNLRNRYRVMVCVGKDANGKYRSKLLKPKAYFRTYNEAYAALVEYNKNPYDLDTDMTVFEVYEKWSEKYFEKLKSPSSVRTIKAAWAYCSQIYNMRIKDVRARHIKGCMEEGQAVVNGKTKTPSPNMKSRIKSMFNILLDYALEYELVDRNYARTFSVSEDIIDGIRKMRRGHIDFTSEEMDVLWKNIDVPYVDVVLIQCYSGWRPQELGLIELDNVDLDNWTFKGGMKTKAGTNRIVPIHEKIKGLVKNRYDEALSLGSQYLLNCPDAVTHRSSIKMTYDKYKTRFDRIVKLLKLNPDHKPHDPRIHFVTAAKNAGVDEYAIKYLVGHSIDDITEKIYTVRTIEWLTKEVQKIK